MFTTFLLFFVFILLFMLVGRVIGGKKGMIVAFVLALGMNFYTYWNSDTMVIKAFKARPAAEGSRLDRITAELAREAKKPKPKVYTIPSQSPNAFATGRDVDNAAVAATDGILKLLTDEELKGVMAHELGHVVNRDTLTSTLAAGMAGGIMLLSRFAFFFGGNDSSGGATSLAVAILAPVAAMVIQMAISREREYGADEYGGRLTKEPEHLASALFKIRNGVKKRPMALAKKNPEAAHLFISNPFEGFSLANIFSSHPPMEKRVDRLMKLQAELGE